MSPAARRLAERLLLLASELPPGPGGIGSHAWSLARQLCSRGWDVSVLGPQDYASEVEIEAFNLKAPFSVGRLPRRRSAVMEGLAWFRRTRRVAKQWRPDVVLASGSRAVWLAWVLCSRRRLPWVAVGHGSEFTRGKGWRKALTRGAFARSSRAVAVSSYTAQLMVQNNLHPAKVVVIPNGGDDDFFFPLNKGAPYEVRRQFGLHADAFVLLTVGSVTERKGQEEVVCALPFLLDLVPEVHYLVVGLPTRGEQLLALAQQLGVAHRVHLAGRLDRPGVRAAYQACDLFVMTSLQTRDGDVEGFGIAVVEAALCGKPAVVSADCGLVEAVEAGETGLLVPPSNSRSIAEAVRHLAKERELLVRMGEKARARALAEQTWAARASQYDALLRSVAGGVRAVRKEG